MNLIEKIQQIDTELAKINTEYDARKKHLEEARKELFAFSKTQIRVGKVSVALADEWNGLHLKFTDDSDSYRPNTIDFPFVDIVKLKEALDKIFNDTISEPKTEQSPADDSEPSQFKHIDV
jgi:hypothetical protein